MNPIVLTTSAAALAGLLVALFKLAYPSAPSWALVTAALLIGVGSSFLISATGSEAWTQQVVASTVIQGLLAAAAAAGISRTDERANIARTNAQMEVARGELIGLSRETPQP